jgi:hypothetical protein
MAILLNDPGCTGVNSANTGTPGCAFFPDQIVGAILIDKDKIFSNADLTTFIPTLQALCLAGSATRVYPIFRFDAVTDNTEDVSVKTLGYGGKRINKEGKYDFTFEMVQGGHCHNNQLRAFNNDNSKKVLFVDKNNMVMSVTDGGTGMKGFSMDFFYAYPFKINQGEEQASFRVRFALDRPEEMNEQMVYFDAGESVEDAIKGLLDIEMYDLGAGSATNKHIIGVRTKCDKVSLYDAYSSTLISAFATIFSATLAGVADNPTGAAGVPLLKGIELTFPTVGVHIISMATPAVLAATPNFIGGTPDNGYECMETLLATVA